MTIHPVRSTSYRCHSNQLRPPALRPEVFGVRLPPANDCLTSVDFDLVPNKPPPGVKLYDEEVEEVEESEEEDEDMEPAAIPATSRAVPPPSAQAQPHSRRAPI
ncbi:uncharacterized protein B0H18DRAFT_967431, partial [Fomitopsis serialis]|uniref:uncharacterized protein n=1 Tax=Fomitopsis serialis TaxID=139415 RepID=UPI002008E924